jgi:hypothetical protein
MITLRIDIVKIKIRIIGKSVDVTTIDVIRHKSKWANHSSSPSTRDIEKVESHNLV